MFSTALRASIPLWRAGCWIRAGLLLAIWGTLAWAAPGGMVRGAAQLVPAAAAISLAFAHTRPGALLRLRRIPGAARLADHLLSTSGRATIDASGVAEGIGILLAAWLFVGPFPIDSLGPGARTAGVALAVAYAWDAVLQAVIDPGWYNPDQPPPRAMRILRAAIPPLLCGVLLVTLFPYNQIAAQVPVPVYLALAATPLLYFPLWAMFDVLLRASVSHAASAGVLWRQEISIDLHSQVKNSVSLLQRYLDEPAPELGEIRSLAREVMMRVEEMRRDVLESPGRRAQRPFGDLMQMTLRIMPSHQRPLCALAAGSDGVVLSPADYQIARRVVPDLVSNALNSGAKKVNVECVAVADGGHGRQIRLAVEDDGPGIRREDLGKPDSSMTILRSRLVLLGGEIEWAASRLGTRVEARWPSQGQGVPARLRLANPGPPRRI
jgi:signal transduction histidine kinase